MGISEIYLAGKVASYTPSQRLKLEEMASQVKLVEESQRRTVQPLY